MFSTRNDLQHSNSRSPAKHQAKTQQSPGEDAEEEATEVLDTRLQACSGLVGSLTGKATYNRHTRPDPWSRDREGAEAPGTMFQGLPVISDCTGRAHPLGRGFAHLTAEPAPLGHRQRVDHVHGAAGGVGLQDGCLASIRKSEVSRDNHGPSGMSRFQGRGGGARLTVTIGGGGAQTRNLQG